ncbi:MAG: response regulator transcription factor [Thermosynechococcaceae cyanobacterium]
MILVALSDLALSKSMRTDLEQAGYTVLQVDAVDEVFDPTHIAQTDLIVIEEALGKTSGLDLCQQLRLAGHTFPILTVMKGDTIDDRVACLLAGADDYVVKPYRSETFLRLIRLYLKPIGAHPGEYLKFDNLILDLSTRSAMRNDRVINLTMKEYDLLKYLMEHPKEVLSRDQILENVWGFDFLGESNVIEVYIRYLRLKIETEGEKKLIYTVRGVGYALRDA